MSRINAEKFIENWYGKPIPKGWDKDYEPLQNLSITELKQMLNEFAEQKENGVTTVEKQCNLPVVSGSLPVYATTFNDKGELEHQRYSVGCAGEIITELSKKVNEFETFIDSFNENYR